MDKQLSHFNPININHTDRVKLTGCVKQSGNLNQPSSKQAYLPVRTKDLAIVTYVALCTFMALYGPQPLLTVLRAEFGVSDTSASLITTLAMLPLGIAPIAYGFLLQRVSARLVLQVASGLLAVCTLGITFVDTFEALLGLRLVQGLLIPAIFTSLMTYISRASAPEQLSRSLALYVAATIFGGFFGRFASGAISTMAGWRASFVICSALLASGVWLLGRLSCAPKASLVPPSIRDALRLLRLPGFLRAYLTIFCAFFVFAALLNYLPFRLTQLWAEAGLTDEGAELRIALMYSGYLMGIVASLCSARSVRFLGGERGAVLAGLGAYLIAILLFNVESTMVVFAVMFLFCGGMFTVHSVLPGLLNRSAPGSRGVVNGLYLSFYYSGGTLGSFLPGLIYAEAGWSAFTAALATVLALALVLASGLHSAPSTPPR